MAHRTFTLASWLHIPFIFPFSQPPNTDYPNLGLVVWSLCQNGDYFTKLRERNLFLPFLQNYFPHKNISQMYLCRSSVTRSILFSLKHLQWLLFSSVSPHFLAVLIGLSGIPFRHRKDNNMGCKEYFPFLRVRGACFPMFKHHDLES